MSQTLYKRPNKVRRNRGVRFSKWRYRNTYLEMSSLASISSCSSMRQKVNRSVGCLQEVVIYVRFPSFSGGERRRPEIRLRWQAIKLIQWKKFGGFRIGGHLQFCHTYLFSQRACPCPCPPCFFSPQRPETWLSPGSCANILARFEVCFQKFG